MCKRQNEGSQVKREDYEKGEMDYQSGNRNEMFAHNDRASEEKLSVRVFVRAKRNEERRNQAH